MIYFPSFNERSFRKRAHRFTSPFIYPHAVVSYFALFGIIVVEHDQYLLRIIEWIASYRYFWKSRFIRITKIVVKRRFEHEISMERVTARGKETINAWKRIVNFSKTGENRLWKRRGRGLTINKVRGGGGCDRISRLISMADASEMRIPSSGAMDSRQFIYRNENSRRWR